MAELTLPLEPDTVTQALVEGGVLSSGQVTHVEAENIGTGKGYAGLSLRLRLRYAPEGAGPATVILKLPSVDAEMRRRVETMNAYEVERRFYAELAVDCGVRTPRCYATGQVPGFGIALYLEDLGHLRLVDQVTSCTLEEAGRVLDDLARLHATWWNEPRLEELTWVPTLDDAEIADAWFPRQEAGIGAWQQQQRGVLDDSFLELAPRVVAALPQLAAQLSQGPRTLLHGDARLENLFLGDEGGPDSVVWFDWQLCRRGRPGREVAYFIGGNLTEQTIAGHREPLMRRYHRALCAGGVDGYDYDALWDDYRAGLLMDFTGRFYWATVFGPVLEMIRNMTDPQLKANYEKAMSAAMRLGEAIQARNAAAIIESQADRLL